MQYKDKETSNKINTRLAFKRIITFLNPPLVKAGKCYKHHLVSDFFSLVDNTNHKMCEQNTFSCKWYK